MVGHQGEQRQRRLKRVRQIAERLVRASQAFAEDGQKVINFADLGQDFARYALAELGDFAMFQAYDVGLRTS